jgi:hypothetical protein
LVPKLISAKQAYDTPEEAKMVIALSISNDIEAIFPIDLDDTESSKGIGSRL